MTESRHRKPEAFRELPDAVLQELIERIVKAVNPDRVILFGSAARGTLGPNSDLDVLVVKSGDYRRIDLLHTIRRGLRGFGWPVDLVVATPEELTRFKDSFSLVHFTAVRDGREIYAG
jgi:uncharacterized protein